MDGCDRWGVTLDSDHHHHHHHHNILSSFLKKHTNNNMKNVGSHNNHVFQGRDNHDDHNHHDLMVEDHDDHSNKGLVRSSEVHDFFDRVTYNNDHNSHHYRVKEESRDHPQLRCGALLHSDDVNTGLHLCVTTNTGSDQSTTDDGASSNAEDKRAKNELAVLQAELERMKSENLKLKATLSQVTHEHESLRMNFNVLRQQQYNQQLLQKSDHQNTKQLEEVQGKVEESKVVPRQFLDLVPNAKNESDEMTSRTVSDDERTLDLSGSPPNNMGLEDIPEESDNNQCWLSNKVPKMSPRKGNIPIDQATTEATMRKARVSVRARSEAPMISDGCQWRKYGQKMAKGNPCPRAYYRCTMAVGCPVRKQVQRCAEDKTILITTYEGNHNHPLPPAAVAMASTTSAAASMLLSGSMPSGDGLMNPNVLARTILPCSTSMATISASAPFPTVTLDLTHSPNPLHFQRPTQQPAFQIPFPPQNAQLSPNFLASLPQIFGQALYNNNNNNNNQSKFSGLHTSSNPAQLQLPNQNAAFSDTLSAATAAIASDPNFTTALAAAISSIIGGTRTVENGTFSNNAPGNSSWAATSGSTDNVTSSRSSMQQ